MINQKDFLYVNNLTKVWDSKKITISFNLKKGETLSLLGPSGCGKSTILKMLAGLIKPDYGDFFLNQVNMQNLLPHKRGIGMVFQDYALFSHLSVEDNIAYGLVSRGVSRKKSRQEIYQWLEIFEITHLQKRTPENLSGGEKQRVALARTLAVNPKLILFDEPLSALDTNLRLRLREELYQRQKKLQYTAIYVTHDQDEAERLGAKIIKMT